MNFPGLGGNEKLKARLSDAMDAGRLPHASILCSPPGGGREALADILAAAMVCTAEPHARPCGHCRGCRKAFSKMHPDIKYVVREADKKQYSIGLIRAMAREAYILPNEAERKVFIIPDGALLTPQCQNAMLRLVEEPPSYAAFLLLAESPAVFLDTLRSRCAEFFVASEEAAGGTDAAAERFMALLASGSPTERAAFAISLEKLKRPELAAFLDALDTALLKALRAENTTPAVRDRLLAACRLRQGLSDLAEANVGVAHISGALAVGFNSIRNEEKK